MKYVVVADGHAVVVEIDGEQVTVDGRPFRATLEPVAGTPLRYLLLDNRPVTMLIERQSAGRWALSLAGERAEVEVLDERSQHIRSLAGSGEQRRSADVLKAPMPGMVLRVQARAGDTVEAGAGLVVLEAMKMENELRAAASARVKAVRVSPGEAVDKGQVLLEFEDAP
jgi:biotin carboxyl carrier protein